jgi:hypothetical protein
LKAPGTLKVVPGALLFEDIEMTAPIYMLIDKHSAPKTGLHAKGNIIYALLRNIEATEVFLCILDNEGGGYFSREATPFSKIEACLVGIAPAKTIAAKTFKAAPQSRSANQPGFIVAALRHAGLLKPAQDASHQHVVGGGWQEWKAEQLARPAEPFELPGAKPEAPVATVAATAEAIIAEEPATGPKGRKHRKEKPGGKEHPTGGEGAVHADPE